MWAIDDRVRSAPEMSAQHLYERALREDVPWRRWNSWVRERANEFLQEHGIPVDAVGPGSDSMPGGLGPSVTASSAEMPAGMVMSEMLIADETPHSSGLSPSGSGQGENQEDCVVM